MARATSIASFTAPNFLENLAVRSDNTILVTSMNTNSIYLVTPLSPTTKSQIIHVFAHPVTGIQEIGRDTFYVSVGTHTSPGTSAIYQLSMQGYPTTSPTVVKILSIPDALFLNGSTVLNGALLLADATLGLLYCVSLPDKSPSISTWLSHPYLEKSQPTDPALAAWPGVNGIYYSPKLKILVATNSERQLVLRIPVDDLGTPGTPEVIATGIPGDDLAIDEEKEVAYVATHVSNSLVRVKLNTTTIEIQGDGIITDVQNAETIIGGIKDRIFAGATACRWSRKPGEEGKVLYVTTEGGIVLPVDGETGVARVLRVEL